MMIKIKSMKNNTENEHKKIKSHIHNHTSFSLFSFAFHEENGPLPNC